LAARKRGFAALSEEELKMISARGGQSTWAQGKAHVFTPSGARNATFKRKNIDKSHKRLPTRKVNGRYEYQVEVNGEKKWVSRQAVFLLRQKGVL